MLFYVERELDIYATCWQDSAQRRHASAHSFAISLSMLSQSSAQAMQISSQDLQRAPQNWLSRAQNLPQV